MKYFVISPVELSEFCRRWAIVRLCSFGSVEREDFTDESDIDLLVEFATGKTPGFFSFQQIADELSLRFFSGRTVDLNTPRSLSKYFRTEVMAQANPLYVER